MNSSGKPTNPMRPLITLGIPAAYADPELKVYSRRTVLATPIHTNRYEINLPLESYLREIIILNVSEINFLVKFHFRKGPSSFESIDLSSSSTAVVSISGWMGSIQYFFPVLTMFAIG